MSEQFVDISVFQPNIDWRAYAQWSDTVAMRSSYGNGYEDQYFLDHRSGALAAGINRIIYYHYAYPQDNSAVAEANWQFYVVGAIRPQDMIVLDFEEDVTQATAEWAYEWLVQQEKNYGGKLPGIYASDAYIRARLQGDTRLDRFPLWLANWQYDPNERPPCPSPWSQYEYLQYTDRAVNIPGIPGTVDANIFLGGNTMGIPTGWTDDPQNQVLTAPNKHTVTQGFREWILTHAWDLNNIPLEEVQAANPVEDYYASTGGTRQVFNYCELAWTSQRGVYVVGIGNELKGCRAERDSLKSEVAALQDSALNQKVQSLEATLSQINTLSAVQ